MKQEKIVDIESRPYIYDLASKTYTKQPEKVKLNIIKRGEQYYFKINNLEPLKELTFIPHKKDSKGKYGYALYRSDAGDIILYKMFKDDYTTLLSYMDDNQTMIAENLDKIDEMMASLDQTGAGLGPNEDEL